jgi:putative CocE/NonD family hydrolase
MKDLITVICILLISFTVTQAQQTNALDSLYVVEDNVLVTSKDGAFISVVVVRSKKETKPLPAILQFTIYARKTDVNKAKKAVDNGYVGVFAYTRGKYNSPDELVPYENDGDDAYAVIDWISKQIWCNGTVGMYGGSYNGFTQWAATKKIHPALKTIVPSAASVPGWDSPMINNVVMNFPFSWTYYVSNNKFLDNEDYNNKKQWNDLEQKWFATGSSYRTLDSLLGRPQNKIFRKWLNHPAYDKYWQSMVPYQEQFSNINIPILTTTGYYDGGQVGALYYMRELDKYNPKANQYLIIGPYGHVGAQGSPDSVYNGYRIDSVANISINGVIFQWFDYVLKQKDKPTFLADKINYQVMGTNKWKHAKSLSSVSNDTLTFYLDNSNGGTLNIQKSKKNKFSKMKVDFADRSSMNSYYYAFRLIWENLNAGGGVMYKSPTLSEDIEFTGCFAGQMNVTINKKDMDYSAVLFEQMPNGKYFFLSYFMGRASYAKSSTKRELLTPNQKTTLPFSNSYFTSKKLSKGSKLVLIVNVNKSSSEQINYGTGKDVNEETIKDAGKPLQIRWYNDSFIKIPVWKN